MDSPDDADDDPSPWMCVDGIVSGHRHSKPKMWLEGVPHWCVDEAEGLEAWVDDFVTDH